MKPEDIMVWERFLTARPDFFDRVDYDYKVGEGAPQAPTLPENIRRDGKILTQKKVDVVGYKGADVYITELKPKADMRALGQVLSYFNLYRKPTVATGFVFKIVIAGEMERELEAVFKEQQIKVIIV